MTDYSSDIKKYTANVDAKAVNAIVKHLGIALKSKDASVVSCSSKDELARVRDSWLKKRLGLGASDADLDRSIAAVCDTMKADTSKHRVTFYYLLAEKTGKLADLAK
jgi:hypothetical protein